MKLTKVLALVAVLALAASTAAVADSLKKGNKEIVATFSYNSLNPDGVADTTKTTNLAGSFGWMLTDAHEVGGRLAYTKFDFGTDTADSQEFGVFYNYNFHVGNGIDPYLGARFSVLGGDLGDIYDNAIGVEGGVKVYPWANGGFNFGVSYEQLKGASGFEDATSTTLFAGIGLKF